MAVDRADAVIVGGGIAGLALAWELQKRGRRRIVVLERRFTGYGSSMRNIGRVRAMQLTPELAEIAIAAQAKHAGLSRELGRSTLFWRAGYALVLYEPDELYLMRDVQRMLRSNSFADRFGRGSKALGSAADPERRCDANRRADPTRRLGPSRRRHVCLSARLPLLGILCCAKALKSPRSGFPALRSAGSWLTETRSSAHW